MELGYNTFEDKRDFVQDGLTGNVKRYSTDKMSFPCYILVHTDEKPIKLTSIQILKQMSLSIKQYDEEQAFQAISIYYNNGDQTVSVGKIFPQQVKSFLKLFETCQVDGYLDKDTKLEDFYLYVLAE